MKVILTGATGLVGGSALLDLIANDAIHEILVLTRKNISDKLAANPKVTVIIHDDFLSYPDGLLKRLSGAEACIWALGGRRAQFPDMATFRTVSVEYLLAAAKAFSAHLAPELPEGTKFRLVFCSGKDAESDQTKSLTFFAETRHVKGLCELGLSHIQAANEARFAAYFVRPAVILPRDSGCMAKMTGSMYGGIDAGKLTKGMVNIALNGFPKAIVNTDELPR